MSGERITTWGTPARTATLWGLTVAVVFAFPPAARAQNVSNDPMALPAWALPDVHVPVSQAPGVQAPTPTPDSSGGVAQAGCVGCGSSGVGGPPLPRDGCAACGPAGPCYPGREPCECDFDEKGPLLRLFGAFVHCICCPDPCYEPHWDILADAGFFTDAPRPITQMRLRVEDALRYPFPDRAEFFWARADGKGKYRPPDGLKGERRLDHDDLFLYTEVATGRAGLFVELDYRHIEPELFANASGFADMNIGTKTLLLDCELLQFSFQFRTFLPTGNFTRGLGVGHVSLEPSLLASVKLAPRTSLEGQLAYWFPIGGDQLYQGPVFHFHQSLNHMLYCCGRDVQLIGVLEMNGYCILGGNYTVPGDGIFSAKDVGKMLSIGPGLRLNICNVIDFGIGSAFSLTSDSIGEQIIRADFRWRF